MRSETDLAWLAGFFDGEGCIQVTRAGRGLRAHVLRVSLTQVVRSPIDRVAEMFGGTVYAKPSKNPRHRLQWGWEITSDRAGSFLRAIRPYLLNKAPEADLAQLFITTRTTRRGRLKTWQEEAEAESFREALVEWHHFDHEGEEVMP